MEAKAIVMGLIGFFLLYGGLVCCIGIAWMHSKSKKAEKVQHKGSDTDLQYNG